MNRDSSSREAKKIEWLAASFVATPHRSLARAIVILLALISLLLVGCSTLSAHCTRENPCRTPSIKVLEW